MENNFNLSEKIEYGLREEKMGNTLIKRDNFESVDVEDVKEFIRLLKEKIDLKCSAGKTFHGSRIGRNQIIQIIDKLAGDKLNGKTKDNR